MRQFVRLITAKEQYWQHQTNEPGSFFLAIFHGNFLPDCFSRAIFSVTLFPRIFSPGNIFPVTFFCETFFPSTYFPADFFPGKFKIEVKIVEEKSGESIFELNFHLKKENSLLLLSTSGCLCSSLRFGWKTPELKTRAQCFKICLYKSAFLV